MSVVAEIDTGHPRGMPFFASTNGSASNASGRP